MGEETYMSGAPPQGSYGHASGLATHEQSAWTTPPHGLDEDLAHLLLQAFQIFPFGMAVTRTADARIVYLNQQFEQLVGLSREDLLGHTFRELYIWADPDLYEHYLRSLNEHGMLRDVEIPYRMPDGSSGDARISLARLEQHEQTYVLTMVQDITEQKRDERALRASEDRYRDLVEHSQDLICTHDLDGRLLSINMRAAHALGYEPQEMVGHDIRKILSTEVHGLFDDYLQAIQRDGTARGYMQLQTRSGKPLIWEYYNTLRIDDVAHPIVRGMARDVTERLATQRALRASEQRFRLLFEQSPDAVMLIDPYTPDSNWPIVDCNAAAQRMSRYTREEFLAQGIDWLRVRPTTTQQDIDYLAELRRDGIVTFETQNRRKDGSIYDVESSVSFVRIDDRELILEIDRDITQRKAVQEGLLYLVEASALLVASLDYRRTLVQVAQLTVPEFADWCAIDLVMPDGSFDRVALAHREPAQVAFAWEIQERYGFEPSLPQGAAQVLRTGKLEFYPAIVPDMLRPISLNDEHWRMLCQLGLTSGLIVPLIAHGRILGSISLE